MDNYKKIAIEAIKNSLPKQELHKIHTKDN